MSKTKQAFQNLFFGRKEETGGTGETVSLSDFVHGTGSKEAAAVVLVSNDSASSAAQHPLLSALKTALTSKPAIGVALAGAAATAVSVIYVSALRSHAEATWSVLLDAATLRIAKGSSSSSKKKKKDDDDHFEKRVGSTRLHLFYADPTFYRSSRKLSAAGSQQQALTINLAAGLFLKECDADGKRAIKALLPRFLAGVVRSMWDGMPQWLRLALWDRWFKQQETTKKIGDASQQQQKSVALASPRHVVVVVTEHAKLPSTYGAAQISGSRVVEVGFPVLGEIALHTAVTHSPAPPAQQQSTTTTTTTTASSGLAQPQEQQQQSSSPSSAAAVAQNISLPQACNYFLRLVFLQQQQQQQQQQRTPAAAVGLQNLVFSDCASAGDATLGEDPQDIRVSAPSNLGITTIARYAASSTDDAPYPIINVDSHAKVSLLPPFPGKSSASSFFPGSSFDPPDVMVQKTFFRRAVKLTVYRSAVDNSSPVVLQKFDRTAGESNNKSKQSSSPTSSMQPQKSANNNNNTVALHSAFVVVSVSNVAARVTSCQVDRNTPLEPLTSQEQTAAVVRRLNTALAAGKQEHPATASFGGAAAGGGGRRGGAAAAAAAASFAPPPTSHNKQHFVFPLVRPSPDQALNRLEKTTTEAATAVLNNAKNNSSNNQQAAAPSPPSPKKSQSSSSRSASSPDSSFNFGGANVGAGGGGEMKKSSSSSSSNAEENPMDSFGGAGGTKGRRIFPLNVEFEFEHKKYVPRRAAEAAATTLPSSSSPTSSITTTQPAKQQQEEQKQKNDDDEEVDFFGNPTASSQEDYEQLSPDQKRRQQQRENRELGLSVHLIWCALGEPPSAVHVKRCNAKQQQQQQDETDNAFRVRVLRESWNVMEIPVSY